VQCFVLVLLRWQASRLPDYFKPCSHAGRKCSALACWSGGSKQHLHIIFITARRLMARPGPWQSTLQRQWAARPWPLRLTSWPWRV